MNTETLSVSVDIDERLRLACEPFDYKFDGISTFTLPKFAAPKRDGSWAIGLIVGPSGSGKSRLMELNYGKPITEGWVASKAIVSQIGHDFASAVDRLTGVGLNSVPSWCRPFHVLSTGEQFRASMARNIQSNSSFDEYTSVVDRVVAKSASSALQRFVRSSGMTGIVLASCHRDISEWLMPDWTFDTSMAELSVRGSLCRPPITISVNPCHRSEWKQFQNHHYMSASISQSARCWSASWDGVLVGFSSSLPMPSGTTRNAWREHRTVVLPDYQGLGIGVRLSDCVAQIHLDEGKRFYSKTAHPRMGKYRDRSKLWRPTKHNHKLAKYQNGTMKNWICRSGLTMFSHEYIGDSQCVTSYSTSKSVKPTQSRYAAMTGYGVTMPDSVSTSPSRNTTSGSGGSKSTLTSPS